MRRRLLVLLLLAFVAVAIVLGCTRKETTTFYVPTTVNEVALDLQWIGGDEITTCGARRAWILRLDTAATPDGWDVTLLLGTDHRLYGCGYASAMTGWPCSEDQRLDRVVPSLSRVMLEGITRPPEEYGIGDFDVACRGIADVVVQSADILATTSPSEPEPQPEPTVVVQTTFTATLRMLGVGQAHVLSGGAVPPQARYGAAASLSDVALGLVDERGRVAFAGGVVGSGAGFVLPAEIWEFDPLTLTFQMTPQALSQPRAGLSATLVDRGGEAAVVFAGGDRGTLGPTIRIDVHQPGQPIDQFNFTTNPRAFHTAARVVATGEPVVFIGSVAYDPVANAFQSAGFSDNYDMFFPAGTGITGSANCGPVAFDRVCRPNGTNMPVARGGLAGVLHSSRTQMWLAGGIGVGPNELDALGNVTFSPTNVAFDTHFDMPVAAAFPLSARLTDTGVSEIQDRPLLFGGQTDLASKASSSAAFYLVNGDNLATPIPSAMRFSRSEGVAVALRDRTVLLTGGRNGTWPYESGIDVLERFIPMASGIGVFELLDPAGPDTCVVDGATAAGCVTLHARRYGHTATRLEGTQTWLDGAVLVIGGALAHGFDPPLPPAELYVPAYDCGGIAPVSPGTGVAAEPPSNATLPPLCDRSRAAEPITDPSTGQLVTP